MSKKSALPVDAYVGARLKERRRMSGVSQQALAEAAGLTFQQVQKYEKGANRVSASRLVQFAQVLDVEPGYFFEGAPGVNEPARTDSEAAFRYSAEGVRLIKAMASISDLTMRQAAVAAVEALAAELARAENPSKARTRKK